MLCSEAILRRTQVARRPGNPRWVKNRKTRGFLLYCQETDWHIGQGGQGRQGNRGYARSEVCYRRRPSHQDGKEDQAHMRGAALVNTSELPAVSRASYAARIGDGYRRRSNHQYGKQDRAYMRLDKKKHPASPSAHPPAAAGPRSPPTFFKNK